ncbi:MAG: carbonic anhydrase [Planctomycetota bacterium]|jgi:carbonic anhydrase
MKKLLTGLAEFQKTAFQQNKDLFQKLANKQEPETLFITCSDSRIDPNLITQTSPGELFICRNAGNIVPPHSHTTGGITASIEFAVMVLGVRHVVICGHTDCGAMKGAMHPENLTSLPHVSNWLSHASAALARVKARSGEINDDHLAELTQENVLMQIKHLETHPSVAAKMATGDLMIHGWVYDIPHGEVSCYDSKEEKFVSIAAYYKKLFG